MRVLGHRGVRPLAGCGPQPPPPVENTVAAVRLALDGGADGVEIDVRRTGDGQLVCHHDPQVADLPVVSATAAALLAAGVERVPDVLAEVRGRGRVVCEVKNVAGEPDFDAPDCATARLLLAVLDPRDDVVVSSFDWFTLEAVRAAGGPPTAFLTPPGVALGAGGQYALGAGHAELHAYQTDVLAAGAAGVARLQAQGLAVVAWPVTEVAMARQLAGLGIDGLICDDPAGVRRGLAAVS